MKVWSLSDRLEPRVSAQVLIPDSLFVHLSLKKKRKRLIFFSPFRLEFSLFNCCRLKSSANHATLIVVSFIAWFFTVELKKRSSLEKFHSFYWIFWKYWVDFCSKENSFERSWIIQKALEIITSNPIKIIETLLDSK